MSAIKIQGLSKIYRSSHMFSVKKTPALEDFNLEIKDNEIFSLLALNGSGKTTAIKLIMGLIFPTAGEIYVFDQKMPSQQALFNMGYLPEVSYFFHYLTAEEILDFYGRLSEIPAGKLRGKIEEVLKLVNLTKDKDRRLGEFSKGMLKRLGMAQALLHDPRLLLLDEPMEGLDPVGIKDMRALILRLKNEGKTILMSSHFISEVEKVCDRVGILHKGKIQEIIEVKNRTTDLEKLFMDIIGQEGVSQ